MLSAVLLRQLLSDIVVTPPSRYMAPPLPVDAVAVLRSMFVLLMLTSVTLFAEVPAIKTAPPFPALQPGVQQSASEMQ